jgi:hypothetical protein
VFLLRSSSSLLFGPPALFPCPYSRSTWKKNSPKFARVFGRWHKPTLFRTPFAARQMRLFGLTEGLGEDGWLKALRLEDYAPRRSGRPEMLLQVLFAYTDAL